MAISMRKVVLALGATALLGGCATYDDGYYGDRYAYGPGYYDTYPGYVGPSVGLGFGYSYYDHDRRYWRGDRHDFRGDRDWRADRDFRGDVRSAEAARGTTGDPNFSSRYLGSDRNTNYWQGSDGRVYEGQNPPNMNPGGSGG